MTPDFFARLAIETDHMFDTIKLTTLKVADLDVGFGFEIRNEEQVSGDCGARRRTAAVSSAARACAGPARRSSPQAVPGA